MPVLGRFPLPVEVIPMARSYVAREIVRLGGQPAWRMGFTTDNGNVILDVAGLTIEDPVALETTINQIAGRGDRRPVRASRRRRDPGGHRTGVQRCRRLLAHARAIRQSGDALEYAMTNLNVPGLAGFADVAAYMRGVGEAARAAAREVARADTNAKNTALLAMAAAIRRDEARLLAANAEDVDAARAAGHDAAFVDRLTLTPATVLAMADGLAEIAALPDPVGEITDLRYRPSGIQVGRMRVPLGVVGIIYESRPNVTADAAGLCLKAGNATILRGGSEAMRSNAAIAACVHQGLREAGLPEDAVQVIATTDRAAVGHLIADDKHVDVIVPRGGKSLIERIAREARTCR